MLIHGLLLPSLKAAFRISSLDDIHHVHGTFGCRRLLMIGSYKFFLGGRCPKRLPFCGSVRHERYYGTFFEEKYKLTSFDHVVIESPQ